MLKKNELASVRMSDFQWASAARYLAWLELNLGIEQIDYGQVFSFRVGRGGMASLIRKKRRQLAQVKRALLAVEVFAGKNKEGMANEELVVLRSLYYTYKAAIGTLVQQVERAEMMEKAQLKQRMLEEMTTNEEDKLF